MERRTTTIAVVGAGITGLSVAWHLSQLSVGHITLLDRAGVGSGATAIQPGGVRQQWSTDIACRMARESYLFYRDAASRLEARIDPGLTTCGYLFVAEAAEQFDDLRRLIDIQHSAGVPSQILAPDDVASLVPGLDASAIVGAAFCAQDGYFDRPQALVAAFSDSNRRAGVDFVFANVVALESDGSGWQLSLSDGSSCFAEQVVVAAGKESALLLQGYGEELPITGEPRFLFYSNPIKERLLEPLVVSQERGFAAKHLADGSVLASDLRASGDPSVDAKSWRRTIRDAIKALVPILEYVSFPVIVRGDYDVTPDKQPILGKVSGCETLWVAAGLNGRGLMMAPTIGRVLADAIVGRDADKALLRFSPSRFSRGLLEPERNVV